MTDISFQHPAKTQTYSTVQEKQSTNESTHAEYGYLSHHIKVGIRPRIAHDTLVAMHTDI